MRSVIDTGAACRVVLQWFSSRGRVILVFAPIKLQKSYISHNAPCKCDVNIHIFPTPHLQFGTEAFLYIKLSCKIECSFNLLVNGQVSVLAFDRSFLPVIKPAAECNMQHVTSTVSQLLGNCSISISETITRDCGARKIWNRMENCFWPDHKPEDS